MLDAWLGTERASTDWYITVLKIQIKICKGQRQVSRDGIVLINYFHLKFKL